MSRPLSILRHQGHLEPTASRPGFTSTVINTVLTLRCAPSTSLHRPPTPHHWQRGQKQGSSRLLGLLHPCTWVGTWAAEVEAGD